MYVCLKKERKKVLLFTWGWAYSCLWPVGWVPASSRSVWRNHCRPSSWPKPTAVAVVWHSLFRGSSCRWVDTFPPHADRTNTKKKKRRKKMKLFIFLFRDGFVTRQKDQEAKKKEKKKKKKDILRSPERIEAAVSYYYERWRSSWNRFSPASCRENVIEAVSRQTLSNPPFCVVSSLPSSYWHSNCCSSSSRCGCSGRLCCSSYCCWRWFPVPCAPFAPLGSILPVSPVDRLCYVML